MSTIQSPPVDSLTPAEVEAALDIARDLVRAGVPVFVAPPDPGAPDEWKLPPKWQTARPLLEVVDRWRPGWALCAVGGHACDFLDVDPRNGGDTSEAGLRSADMWPVSYGVAATPSGGTHYVIAPLRVPKGKLTEGIDLQGGLPGEDPATGKTHYGFVFISPTVRRSQVDGITRPYRWIAPPDVDLLLEEAATDDSGQAIATQVLGKRQRGKDPGQIGDGSVAPPDPPGLLHTMVAAFEQLTREGSNRTQELDNLAMLAGHGVPQYWTAEAARERLMEAASANGYIAVHGRRAAEIQIDSGLTDGACAPWAAPDPSEQAYRREVELELRRLKIREDAQERLQVDRENTPIGEADRFVTGGSFIHDTPEHVPSVWGRDDDVLWSQGEPLIISGPTGVGKTTLGGQVVAARIGLIPDVLGYPVEPGRRVLYLAMDRPRQIARALGRIMRAFPKETLDDRIVFWRGPPPVDLARHPGMLLELARRADADTVVLDSLKDAAVKLSDEEVGQGLHRAMQLCIASDIEVMVYHHQTKHGAGGITKPNSLSDVYGSAFITAGVGSVILLWGDAGDPIIELSHLKKPASEIGPVMLTVDHQAGIASILPSRDVLDLLLAWPRTAREVAVILFGENPNDAKVEKARRKIVKLMDKGLAVRLSGPASGGGDPGRKGGGEGAKYGAAAGARSVHDRSTIGPRTVHVDQEKGASSQVDRSTHEKPPDRSTESVHALHEKNVSAGRSVHASVHAVHAAHSPPTHTASLERQGEGMGEDHENPGRLADLDTWPTVPSAAELNGDHQDQRNCERCGMPTNQLVHGECPDCAWQRGPVTGKNAE